MKTNRILGHSGGKFHCFWKSIRGRETILCSFPGSWFGSGVRRKFLLQAEDRHSDCASFGSHGRRVAPFFGGQFAPESYFMSVAQELVWERSPAEVSSAG